MTTNPNVSRGSFGSVGFPPADFSKCQAFHQCHHQCHHSYHQGRRRKHHGERSVAVELFLFGFRQHPGVFFWFGKKKHGSLWWKGVVGMKSPLVVCWFFVLFFFVFFLVMIFNCWSKLLASSLFYIHNNYARNTWNLDEWIPIKKRSPVKHTLFSKGSSSVKFQKGYNN